jgi:hypothetical protein
MVKGGPNYVGGVKASGGLGGWILCWTKLIRGYLVFCLEFRRCLGLWL